MDYKAKYKIYKKMPIISAILTEVLFVIWSFIDVNVFEKSIDLGYFFYHDYRYSYGIMQLDSRAGAIIIWLLIGAVLSVLVWFLTSLKISAVVVQTDAVLEINERQKKAEIELIQSEINEKKDDTAVINNDDSDDNESINNT